MSVICNGQLSAFLEGIIRFLYYTWFGPTLSWQSKCCSCIIIVCQWNSYISQRSERASVFYKFSSYMLCLFNMVLFTFYNIFVYAVLRKALGNWKRLLLSRWTIRKAFKITAVRNKWRVTIINVLFLWAWHDWRLDGQRRKTAPNPLPSDLEQMNGRTGFKKENKNSQIY